MLLMIQEGIRGGMCQAVFRYDKASNKYMKDYNKSIKSLYLEYLDANNSYGQAMSQKLPVNSFKWVGDISKFNESFIKNCDENNDEGYILEVDVEYSKELFNLLKDLTFLLKIEKINKCEKLIYSIESKEKYVVHIRATKQALNHGLKFKKVHRVIQFSQKARLKSYIDINTELRRDANNDFEKDFCKLINNSVFWKNNGKCKKLQRY